MRIQLTEIIDDFSFALKAIDSTGPQGASKTRIYRPGVGPLTEAETISKTFLLLREIKPEVYLSASSKSYPKSRQKCDIVIPNHWAIEFKLIRPFGENGIEAEHWSENILHPYPGNVSALGDCIKLMQSGFEERKAIIVFGYEHTPPLISLLPAVKSFELVADKILSIKLNLVKEVLIVDLIHPVHQQAMVFGWEICNNVESHSKEGML